MPGRPVRAPSALAGPVANEVSAALVPVVRRSPVSRSCGILILLALVAPVLSGCSKAENRAFRASPGLAWISIPLAEADEASEGAKEAPAPTPAPGPAETAAAQAPEAAPVEPAAAPEKAPEELPAAQAAPDAPAPSAMPPKEAASMLPQEVEIWSALRYPDDLKLESPVALTLKQKGFEETFYDHPFLKTQSNTKAVFKRVIANDHKRQNFDMRDGLILPLPSTLTASVPGVANRTLVYSYCVMDGRKKRPWRGNSATKQAWSRWKAA